MRTIDFITEELTYWRTVIDTLSALEIEKLKLSQFEMLRYAYQRVLDLNIAKDKV